MGTIIYQKQVYRADLQKNPGVMYLFGDNDERAGLGGQAKEMRGEPNAVGIHTKKTPSRSVSAFWSDNEWSDNTGKIIMDMLPVVNHLKDGGVVVIPADGLGTGLSRMEEVCPRSFEYLQTALRALNDFTY